MESTRDLYRILQVDPSAAEVVIQAAYRALARCFHPDSGRPDAARMSELNRAYAVLRDPDARRQYDLQRSMARAQPIRVTDAGGRTDPWTPRRPADDHVVLDFGRYAGWSVRELARHDPDYLRWLCRHSSGLRFREAIARVLPREPDLQRRANSVA